LIYLRAGSSLRLPQHWRKGVEWPRPTD
jgi:hypothetical protein